jgi:hypothetical protein
MNFDLAGIFSFLRAAAENWKVGLAAFLAGSAVIAADLFGFPHPDILGAWVGLATVFAFAGLAVLVSSGVALAVDRARRQRKEVIDAKTKEESALANIETLRRLELEDLYSVMTAFRHRFDVQHGSVGYELARKGIYVMRGLPGRTIVCELNPAILRERENLLPALKRVVESGRPYATVRRIKNGWDADIK